MYYFSNLLKMDVTKLSIGDLIVFIMDVISLILVQMVQGGSLNYYINVGFPGHFTPYFLFVLDFLCASMFIFTFVNAYSYFHKQGKAFHLNNDVRTHNANCKDDVKKGILQFSYVSWIFYIFTVIMKLAIIFGSDCVEEMNKHYKFVPQLLQVVIGMTAVVFFLIVEGLNINSDGNEFTPNTSGICKKVGIEIFDSVDILAVLMIGDHLSKTMEIFVFALASINFILPTISLYILSITHFGLIYKKCYGLRLLLILSKLILIDIPFFAVRMYLWLVFKNDFSIFLMKNIFHIFLTLRQVHKDLIHFFWPDDTKGKFDVIPLNDTPQQHIGNGTVNVHV